MKSQREILSGTRFLTFLTSDEFFRVLIFFFVFLVISFFICIFAAESMIIGL